MIPTLLDLMLILMVSTDAALHLILALCKKPYYCSVSVICLRMGVEFQKLMSPCLWTQTHVSFILNHHYVTEQTWVCSPDAQQSQSTDARLWGRKVQHLLQGTKQGSLQLMLKRPKTPQWLLGKGFKAKERDRVSGCMINSWTLF